MWVILPNQVESRLTMAMIVQILATKGIMQHAPRHVCLPPAALQASGPPLRPQLHIDGLAGNAAVIDLPRDAQVAALTLHPGPTALQWATLGGCARGLLCVPDVHAKCFVERLICPLADRSHPVGAPDVLHQPVVLAVLSGSIAGDDDSMVQIGGLGGAVGVVVQTPRVEAERVVAGVNCRQIVGRWWRNTAKPQLRTRNESGGRHALVRSSGSGSSSNVVLVCWYVAVCAGRAWHAWRHCPTAGMAAASPLELT